MNGAAGAGRPPARIVFVFLDGVGIGPADPERNPFLRAELPVIRGLMGGEIVTLEDTHRGGAPGGSVPDAEASEGSIWDHGLSKGPGGDPGRGGVVVRGLDATLGVEGMPQSGTGQASLMTGVNAAERFGRHFGPWVPHVLRPLVSERSFLRRLTEAGRVAQVANAYPSRYRDGMMRRRTAGFPLAAHEAGLLTRDEDDLAAERALASEIVTTGWRERLGFMDIAEVEPREAGARLATLAREAELTAFGHYSTDGAGHSQEMEPAILALERVDSFLGGLVDGMSADTLLIVTSDHGNIEDVTEGHTRYPTLGLAVGPGAEALDSAHTIADVAARVLDALEVEA